MVNEARSFGAAALLTILGLAVLLWGVSLNNGQAPNGPIVLGGAIIVVAIAILSAGVIRLDARHEAE
jgi:hypothetical protein